MSRVRPDKAILRGSGPGQILLTDAIGELHFADLVASIPAIPTSFNWTYAAGVGVAGGPAVVTADSGFGDTLTFSVTEGGVAGSIFTGTISNTGSGVPDTFGVDIATGTDGQVLSSQGGVLQWINIAPSGFNCTDLNSCSIADLGDGPPLGANEGDLLVFTGGTWNLLPASATSGTVLTSNGALTVPSYQALPSGTTDTNITDGVLPVATGARLADFGNNPLDFTNLSNFTVSANQTLFTDGDSSSRFFVTFDGANDYIEFTTGGNSILGGATDFDISMYAGRFLNLQGSEVRFASPSGTYRFADSDSPVAPIDLTLPNQDNAQTVVLTVDETSGIIYRTDLIQTSPHFFNTDLVTPGTVPSLTHDANNVPIVVNNAASWVINAGNILFNSTSFTVALQSATDIVLDAGSTNVILTQTPPSNPLNDNILVRNAVTGVIELRDAGTIGSTFNCTDLNGCNLEDVGDVNGPTSGGDLLVRNNPNTGWDTLTSGNPGDLLTISGGGDPAWQAPAPDANDIDYISNVQLVGTDLTFTGIGNAFSGPVDLSSLSGSGGFNVSDGGPGEFIDTHAVVPETVTFTMSTVPNSSPTGDVPENIVVRTGNSFDFQHTPVTEFQFQMPPGIVTNGVMTLDYLFGPHFNGKTLRKLFGCATFAGPCAITLTATYQSGGLSVPLPEVLTITAPAAGYFCTFLNLLTPVTITAGDSIKLTVTADGGGCASNFLGGASVQ